ncbi:hypothetical protein D3C73_1530890 [compost metagenome]
MDKVNRAMAINTGRRPIRSDNAPPTGNQKKFETPTNSVTNSASEVLRCNTVLPKVGAYTVIR